MLDRVAFAHGIARVFAAYNRKPGDAQLDAWYDAVCTRFDEQAWQAACRWAVDTLKKLPTPADLLECKHALPVQAHSCGLCYQSPGFVEAPTYTSWGQHYRVLKKCPNRGRPQSEWEGPPAPEDDWPQFVETDEPRPEPPITSPQARELVNQFLSRKP